MASKLAEAIREAGDMAAGILLYRIRFWSQFRMLECDGRFWVARSREDWCEDSGLSLKQFRRAATELAEKGLIDRRQAYIGGTKKVWFTEQTETPKGPSGPVAQNSKRPERALCSGTKRPHRARSLFREKSRRGEKGDAAASLDLGPETEEDSGRSSKDGNEEGYAVKAEDVLANRTWELKPKGKAVDPDAPKQLVTQWLKAVSGDGTFAKLTGKQQGQIGQFAKAVASAERPSEVLGRVLADWSGFVAQVRADKGLQFVPEKPDVGFALKHAETAVNWFRQGQGPAQATKAPHDLLKAMGVKE